MLELEARYGIPACITSMTSVYKELGLSPNDPMDADTRLMVQEKLLDQMRRVYIEAQGGFVADRSPLDLIAYLVMNLPQVLTEEQTKRAFRYTQDCYDLANTHLACIIRVQPGIPLVEDAEKAVAQPFYIETLNTVIGQLNQSDRLYMRTMTMNRAATDLEDRVSSLVEVYREVRSEWTKVIAEASLH